MTSYEFVDYEGKGEIAIIKMNRPERSNSKSQEMMRDLEAAFETAEGDDTVRVIILTGVGNAFCAGIDVKEIKEPEEREKARKEILRKRRLGRDIFYRVSNFNIAKALITAVNGHALGGGFFLAMGGDLVIAAESAIFQEGEPLMGFTGGGSTLAHQMIPFHIAMEIALAKKLTARRAYEIGLVNKVVPDHELMPAAIEMANGLLELAPLSLKYTVEGVRAATIIKRDPLVDALSQFLEYEILPKTEDVSEAMRAIAEKRKPIWKGR